MKSLPELRLKDLDNKPVARSELKGEAFVLDFWATWCAPCIAEIPALNRLQDKYSSKDIKIVGVAMMSGSVAEVKSFVARHNVKYLVLVGDDTQAYELNIMGYPTTYLVTGDWKVYRVYIGAGPRKIRQLESDIERLLDSGAK
jgi:thiol-disulfide isomerase/thioredoxin